MTYVISDVHSHYRDLMALLEQINFSDSDFLILDGDLTDKGPDPVEVVKFAMSVPNVTTLLGNHDMMAVNAISERFQDDSAILWFANHGDYTYEEFCAAGESFVEKYVQWMAARELFCELSVNGRAFLVTHAGVDLTGHENDAMIDPAEVLKNMNPSEIVWNRYAQQLMRRPELQQKLLKTIVCGHTPTCNFEKKYAGKIIVSDKLICTDCGAAYGQPWSRLGCIRLDDMRGFYVETRKGNG